MVKLDEAFEDWMDEEMLPSGQTRREFAQQRSIALADLMWAFGAGWWLGQRQLLEEQE